MSSFREALTCQRSQGGTWNRGFYDPGDSDEFTIYASVQPISGKELRILPEGRRETATYTLYTDTKMNEQGSAQLPDVVTIDGEIYEVIKVFPWQNTALAHYKVIVGKPTAHDHS